MGDMSKLGNTSSEQEMLRVWSAAELGVKPVFCPICGKEKTWRRGVVLGAVIRVPIMCKCEVEAEKEEKRRKEAREKQERINRLLSLSNLGERFIGASFDSFDPVPGTEKCLETVRDYAENFGKKTRDGLCIYGKAGNGKSHLAAALVNRVINRGYTAVFIEAPELFAKIKATYGAEGSGNEDKIMKALRRCDLLVLDDAGAEKPSEWVQEKFYQVINDRYKKNLPVVITTNTKDMAGLEDIVGFRAYDRILEMCIPVKNNGESYRRKIAVERLRKG